MKPLIMMGKVTRQCPQTTTFEERGEPKQIRTEVLLRAYQLGQTGSLRGKVAEEGNYIPIAATLPPPE